MIHKINIEELLPRPHVINVFRGKKVHWEHKLCRKRNRTRNPHDHVIHELRRVLPGRTAKTLLMLLDRIGLDWIALRIFLGGRGGGDRGRWVGREVFGGSTGG